MEWKKRRRSPLGDGGSGDRMVFIRRERFGLARRYVLAGVIAMALASGTPVAGSAPTYPPNQGAAGSKGASGNNYDGLAGFQMLTQLVAQPGFFIAHPGQVNPSFSSDFIGLGTAKGEGIANCPDQWGPSWQVYVDGYAFSTYFCEDLQYIPGDAQSQSFIIQRRYSACFPGETGAAWDVKWQGVVKACISESFSRTDFVSAGAENGNNRPNQPLAISYVQMQYRVSGATYAYWGSYAKHADSPYTITSFGTRTSYRIAP